MRTTVLKHKGFVCKILLSLLVAPFRGLGVERNGTIKKKCFFQSTIPQNKKTK